jgi:hypothetical protein
LFKGLSRDGFLFVGDFICKKLLIINISVLKSGSNL